MKITKVRIVTKGLIIWVSSKLFLLTKGNKGNDKVGLATTIYKKIFLKNATVEYFLQNREWVRHEVQHVMQRKRLGLPLFMLKYFWYSITTGYEDNPFEKEARDLSITAFPDGIVLYSINPNILVMNEATFKSVFFISVQAADSITLPEINRVLNLKFQTLPQIQITY